MNEIRSPGCENSFPHLKHMYEGITEIKNSIPGFDTPSLTLETFWFYWFYILIVRALLWCFNYILWVIFLRTTLLSLVFWCVSFSKTHDPGHGDRKTSTVVLACNIIWLLNVGFWRGVSIYIYIYVHTHSTSSPHPCTRISNPKLFLAEA